MEIAHETMIEVGSPADWRYVGGHIDCIVAERVWVRLLPDCERVVESNVRDTISSESMPIVRRPYKRIVSLKKSAYEGSKSAPFDRSFFGTAGGGAPKAR